MPDAPPTSNEHLVAIIHEHWVKYVRIAIVFVLLYLISLLLFYLAGLSAYHEIGLSQILLLSALGLLLVNHHWFFMAVLSQAENQLIITSRRVIWIRHRLFFDEEMMEYAFEKMKFVEARKSTIWQYVLQYGTLRFEQGSPISYVPHPNDAARLIEQAMGMM